jgi:hypothetical protein
MLVEKKIVVLVVAVEIEEVSILTFCYLCCCIVLFLSEMSSKRQNLQQNFEKLKEMLFSFEVLVAVEENKKTFFSFLFLGFKFFSPLKITFFPTKFFLSFFFFNLLIYLFVFFLFDSFLTATTSFSKIRRRAQIIHDNDMPLTSREINRFPTELIFLGNNRFTLFD